MANILVPVAVPAVSFSVEEAEAIGSRLASSNVGRRIVSAGENTMSKKLHQVLEKLKKVLNLKFLGSYST